MPKLSKSEHVAGGREPDDGANGFEGFRRRRMRGLLTSHLIDLALLWPFSLFLFVQIFRHLDSPEVWVYAGVFVLSCVVGLVRDHLRSARQRCPDCSGLMRRGVGEPGDPIEFVCRRCGVVWETGFSVPDGSG